MSNNTLRILTGLIGIPVVVGLIYLGGWVFGIAVAIVALMAQWEVYAMMEAGGMRPFRWVGILVGGLVALRAFAPAEIPYEPYLALALVVLVVALPFLRTEQPFQDLGATALGVAYPTFLLSFLIRIREFDTAAIDDTLAFYLTLSLFVLIWAADTFAYFVGRQFGKRPLFPRVSPKKTWEGFMGGLVGATLLAVGLKFWVLAFLPWPSILVLGLTCGAIAPLGDLAESRLKRSVGVKDSGHVLPGHGGLLDRFDAMVVAAPLVYAYLEVFIV